MVVLVRILFNIILVSKIILVDLFKNGNSLLERSQDYRQLNQEKFLNIVSVLLLTVP